MHGGISMEQNNGKKIYNIGLLGFGAMGQTHAYAIHNFPYFYKDLPFSARIGGVVTRSMEKSLRVCEQYGFDTAYPDEDAVLADPEIDIIDICTPNCLHFETLKKAILAGKAIYCEKPLCVSVQEAQEIALLAAEHHTVGHIVFNNRHLAPIRRARQLIDEGKLGRILSFRAEYLHNSALNIHKNAGWKQDKTVCGGGVLFDLGSHVIDLIYSLCGEFQSVSGLAQIAYPTRIGMNGEAWQTNADEAFYMTAVLKNGACGTITASKLANGTNDDLNIEVVGEQGALRFSLMEPNWLYFYDATAADAPIGGMRGFTRIECVGRYPAPAGLFPSPKAARGWLEGHVESMLHFLTQVHLGESGHPDFHDAAHVQAVMDTAYRSAASNGIRLEVPEL